MRTSFLISALLIWHVGLGQVGNEGPDAPDMSVAYNGGTGFTFTLSNTPISNNYMGMYVEGILPYVPLPDIFWRFQGYAVFQFATPADADDSAHWVIHDPYRALPVALADLADTLTEARDSIFSLDPLNCSSWTWDFPNNGIPATLLSSIDPFTALPHDPNTEYCFLAVAIATNPYHLDPVCDTLQQVIMSRGGAAGQLVTHCVIGAQLGMLEAALADVSIGPMPATGPVQFSGRAGEAYRIRVVSALGGIVHDTVVRNGGLIDPTGWSAGAYRAIVSDRAGQRRILPILVAH